MATTVGASLAIAHAAGIRVLATGGIGGVHHESERTFDVSNDLLALASNPVATVSAGFKSILDLNRSLEALETLGIAVVGYKTHRLPDFYSLDSGLYIPRMECAEQIAAILDTNEGLGIQAGVVVANPPPADLAFSQDELAALVRDATASARREGIEGKRLTPYLLAQIAERTGGRSVELNVALLVSNATVAAEIARSVSRRTAT
jgi:pseudouridine-5'-phosphate glycosidase